MSEINQKEYLKRYLSKDGKKDKKSKRKKKEKAVPSRVKIIDDDLDNQIFTEAVQDDLQEAEDAPQIVQIIDDRPAELRSDVFLSSTFKPVIIIKDEEIDSDSQNNCKEQGDFSPKGKVKQESNSDKSEEANGIKIKREPVDADDCYDESPPRRIREDDYSPPRRGRDGDDHGINERQVDDSSPPRRKHSDDNSPPRRSRKDVDCSPPRRSKNKQNSPPSSRNAKIKTENSPPRRRNGDDSSPPRRKNYDDNSPPRRKNYGDSSPPRRKKYNGSSPARGNKDFSPPRRKRNSDNSPPRKSKRFDNSPPRKDHKQSRSEIKQERSPEPKKKSRWSETDKPSDKMTKTLDGKAAGLQNAKHLVEETTALRKREDELYRTMPAEVSGAGASTVLRDRKTGRIRDLAEENAEKQEKENREAVVKEKYARWGKGCKQTDDYNAKLQQDAYEMNKPMARYADDEDLERYRKEQEREGDPMLAHTKKRKKESDERAGKPLKPQFEGSFMPNRYGIRPGHKWDGVDRSNGYEKKWFEVQNARQAERHEWNQWNTEDM